MNDFHHFQVHGADSPTLLGRLALLLNRNRVSVRMFEMRPRDEAKDLRISFDIHCTHDRAVRVANQLTQVLEVQEVNWSTKVAAAA